MISAHTLTSWSETPRTLCEEMALEAVLCGATEGESIEWNGATREPFLTLQAEGAVKLQAVIRLSGGCVTVHFWESTGGVRSHLKVKTT